VRELLSGEGAVVHIVADGAAAVKALEDADTPIDVVLMDLQMPVMDGFTATDMIRNRLARTELPIIAMTANAMASDREACLAGGMNDHVGKPFEIDHLVEVLRRHVYAGKAVPPPVASPDADAPGLPATVAAAAQAAGVDIATAVRRLGGRLDVYLRLVHSLNNELREAPARLRAAGHQADDATAATLLHALRGPVATMGAEALAGVLAACEKKLAQKAGPTLRVLAPALEAMATSLDGLCVLESAIGEALPASPVDPGATQDAGQTRANLRKLAGQLNNFDMAATDTIAAMRQYQAQGADAMLQRLDDAVQALEFDAALQLCETWLEELSA
jgi:CheY-like chemotaxis protein